MTPDPWHPLRKITAARIALGRTGGSISTREQLEFRLAHARARDAVHAPFDMQPLAMALRMLGAEVMTAESAAKNRAEYLRRPDLGRVLSADSRSMLLERSSILRRQDLAIIVSDGLSTHAAATQAPLVLAPLLSSLRRAKWSVAPIIIARNARVALQDEVGEILNAQLSLILLGERPGLGAVDSLGAYFTFGPAPGRVDADRNCISNIRDGGLSPGLAAQKIHLLLEKSRNAGFSGVLLKDDTTQLIEDDELAMLKPLEHSAGETAL